MTHRKKITALCAAILAMSACEMPRFEGPQVQAPPPGFFIQDGTAASHTLLPNMQHAFHTAWVHTDVSGVSTIFIDGYSGKATMDDAIAAVEMMREAATDPDTRFGGIEALTIDGRPAWGWSERIESLDRGLEQVSYRAMIPYDTITYTVEFTSGEPPIKLAAPDTLRATVASFAIGKTTWNFPMIAMGLGAILLLGNLWRGQRRARSAQLRTITLVQVPRPDEEEKPPLDGGPLTVDVAEPGTPLPAAPGGVG